MGVTEVPHGAEPVLVLPGTTLPTSSAPRPRMRATGVVDVFEVNMTLLSLSAFGGATAGSISTRHAMAITLLRQLRLL
jgi:hypothetical protein